MNCGFVDVWRRIMNDGNMRFSIERSGYICYIDNVISDIMVSMRFIFYTRGR